MYNTPKDIRCELGTRMDGITQLNTQGSRKNTARVSRSIRKPFWSGTAVLYPFFPKLIVRKCCFYELTKNTGDLLQDLLSKKHKNQTNICELGPRAEIRRFPYSIEERSLGMRAGSPPTAQAQSQWQSQAQSQAQARDENRRQPPSNLVRHFGAVLVESLVGHPATEAHG